jgi:hypothetical protein
LQEVNLLPDIVFTLQAEAEGGKNEQQQKQHGRFLRASILQSQEPSLFDSCRAK